MLKIKYYNTNVGIIFKVVSCASYNSVYKLETYCDVINDTPAENIQSLTHNWYKISDIPFSIKKKVKAHNVLIGYELKNPSLVSDKIPTFLSPNLMYYEEDTDSYSGEYKEFAYLYKPKFEDQPEKLEDVSFELTHLGDIEVSNFTSPEKMQIKQSNETFGGKHTTVDLSSIVRYEELYELLTPEFLVHNCPCSLSSEQMFKIVRYYVKENINPRVARITSDYDFCFTVKKVLNKKPSLVIKSKKPTEELFEVFEMTYSGYRGGSSGYNGYTPIAPMNADSLEDMKNKLEKYLTELIDDINTKVEQCECCKGTGHIVTRVKTDFKL